MQSYIFTIDTAKKRQPKASLQAFSKCYICQECSQCCYYSNKYKKGGNSSRDPIGFQWLLLQYSVLSFFGPITKKQRRLQRVFKYLELLHSVTMSKFTIYTIGNLNSLNSVKISQCRCFNLMQLVTMKIFDCLSMLSKKIDQRKLLSTDVTHHL